MTIGIRGTSGVVRAGNEKKPPAIYVLDGKVTLTSDPTEILVLAGEIAEAIQTVSGIQVQVRPLREEEIDAFAIDEIRKSTGIQDRIQNDSHLNLDLILFGVSDTPAEVNEPLVEYVVIGGNEYSTNLGSLDLGSSNLSNSDIDPLKYMTK
jgi:20S proteasome alpha/beta subunit